MTQPAQHLGHRARHLPRGLVWLRAQVRSRDQYDGQAQGLGCVNLGARTAAAGVFGDDMRDMMGAQQVQITLQGERPARDDRRRIGQRQHAGRIDQAQQIMVPGLCGESGKVLFADGQKHPRRGLGQGGDGRCDIRNEMATGEPTPGRALEPQQGDIGSGTGGDGVAAHLRGKRVGGIDDMGDAFRNQPGVQALDAAETANPCWQVLGSRRVGASGIGKHRVNAAHGQCPGEGAGFGCAAQQKDALHV